MQALNNVPNQMEPATVTGLPLTAEWVVSAACTRGCAHRYVCVLTQVETAPTLPIPMRPASVAESVYLLGDPLQGNSCPANASQPSRLCPKGSAAAYQSLLCCMWAALIV